MIEAVQLLADPAPDIALAEAIKPSAEHAVEGLDAEKLLGEAIRILAESCDLDEDIKLREVLKQLAQRANAEQLHAAILACVGSPYQLEAATAAYEEAEEPDDVKPLRVVG